MQPNDDLLLRAALRDLPVGKPSPDFDAAVLAQFGAHRAPWYQTAWYEWRPCFAAILAASLVTSFVVLTIRPQNGTAMTNEGTSPQYQRQIETMLEPAFGGQIALDGTSGPARADSSHYPVRHSQIIVRPRSVQIG